MTHSATTPSQFVGCDVGKASIVVFDQRSGTTHSIENTPDALHRFATELDPTCLVVCEATGGYEAALLDALTRAGRPAHRADARKVKAFIRSFGTLGKTDAIDAQHLAQYGRERHTSLIRWQPPEPARLHLQALVLVRRDLVADRVAWNNRQQAPTAAYASAAIAAMVACINAQIDTVNTQIEQLLNDVQPLARARDVLRTIKGIGPIVSVSLLALMPELGSIDRRHAAALAPHPKQSGNSNAYRRTKGGRPEIKRILFTAAMAARRFNPQLKAFFNRLVADGKKTSSPSPPSCGKSSSSLMQSSEITVAFN
jgi:transposase